MKRIVALLATFVAFFATTAFAYDFGTNPSGDWKSTPYTAGVPQGHTFTLSKPVKQLSIRVFDPPGGLTPGVKFSITVDGNPIGKPNMEPKSQRFTFYNVPAGKHSFVVTATKDSNIAVGVDIPNVR